jgi:butyryl-CoA dehydrogenase/short/branched chain acyl-CoA dehydrogenase
MAENNGPRALTQLGDDERMFRKTVRQIAAEEIAPLVREMDDAQQMNAGLIRKLFDLGLMGIEIPEQYGGAAGSFFEAILAVEEISAVDPAVGVLVDVQNTLCINALIRWATEEQKRRYLPRLATDTVGLGRLRARDPRDAAWRCIRSERPEAMDHQRQRGGPLHRLRHA